GAFMEAHSAEEMQRHVKTYFAVYFALLVLTVATVGVAHMQTTTAMHILAAMLVAVVKGSLVAAIFMHLSNEKKIIVYSLVLTVTLFAALMLFPILVECEIFHYLDRMVS
ncbi:MAG: cytochrome C oxidase subunit IV family protein, partial [Bdellovibrionales bacterium]|nr:cytochrome C oxidase subunit IV family protein [Bdellovibrionales bacterium]